MIKNPGSRLILPLLMLFIMFSVYFFTINKYVIDDCNKSKGIIDSHLNSLRNISDTSYLTQAKHGGYDIAMYKKLFFPADLLFPIAYSLLFLCAASVFRKKWYYLAFILMISTGAIFDYTENILFLKFLNQNDDHLASKIVWVTLIKIFLFVINMLLSVGGLVILWRRSLRT